MNDSIFNRLSWISTISIITIYTLLALNTFLKYDDYCFRVQMANQNSFFVLWDHYIKADGRALSPIYLFRNLIVKYLSPEFIAIISTSCLIGIGYFIMKSANRFLGINYKNFAYQLNITLLVSVCLWLGVRANLSRVIYWPIGSFYIYVALAFIGALYYLFNQTNKIIFTILGVLTIFGGINVAFPFLIIYILYGLFIKNGIKIHLGVFVVFIISFLIMFLSPGNFSRASKIESGYDWQLISMIKNYFIVFWEYLMMSKWIVITSFLSAFFFDLSKVTNDDFKKKLVKVSILMILGAMLTIVPFVILPQAASRHTSLFFQLMLFIGLMYFTLYVRFFSFFQRITIIRLAVLSVFILFLFEGIQQYHLSREIKSQINLRLLILKKSQNGNPVIVKEIIPNSKLYTHFYKDLTNERWSYDCLSKYYQCGEIRFSIK